LSSDEHEAYWPYCSDFGPVDLASVAIFCRSLRLVATDRRLGTRPIVYYVQPPNTEHKTNAAFLLGTYCMLVHGLTPE
ncbi:hypothetical protein T484DRAFT_1602094, partial [Baffinella frigidus]